MRKPQPLNIKDVKADARHTSGIRSASEIEVYVLHATVGTNLAETIRWLTTNPNSNVSVARLIDYDGNIYKIADDLVVANHIGFSRIGDNSPNRCSLGIEFLNANNGRDPYRPAQIYSGALQIREWYYYHGVKPIIPHALVDTEGKSDPYLFPWEQFYKTLWQLCSELW